MASSDTLADRVVVCQVRFVTVVFFSFHVTALSNWAGMSAVPPRYRSGFGKFISLVT
jgi:hypothetical protein